MRPRTLLFFMAPLLFAGCGLVDGGNGPSRDAAPPVSDQEQELTYQGITFAVPSRLPVSEPDAYEFQCLTSQDPGVYLAPTKEPLVAASCPATLEYAETIHVRPVGSQDAGDRTVEGQGRDERWVASHPANSWYEVVLPAYGVMFTFYELDAATREAVLESVREG